MLRLLVALQVGATMPGAPPVQPPPATAPAGAPTPVPASPPPTVPPAGPVSAAPRPVEPDRAPEPVRFFARLDLGLGTAGFSENESLLRASGYGGVKLWATYDFAFMIHERVGAGLWTGLARRSAAPELGPALGEVAYFVGGEVPVLIAGRRAIALHAVPRVGFAAGKLASGDASNVDFQTALMWGGAVTLTSFDWHLGGTIAFMRASTGPAGEVGRDHDYGGLYFAVGGNLGG
jgi:hypothetical protein